MTGLCKHHVSPNASLFFILIHITIDEAMREDVVNTHDVRRCCRPWRERACDGREVGGSEDGDGGVVLGED
ncbi:hypothetical protein RJT34_20424 [Clitoria ternatea]|uniref:Uncharacterized protein n=1 Tax=Clitoria ternatea TaxID=43366 RepID=A0AAN9P568_CLITE